MTKAITGNTDKATAHAVEVITEYPEGVATFRIDDAYRYGYGMLRGDEYLVRMQCNDLERMELEARRFSRALVVDRQYTDR